MSFSQDSATFHCLTGCPSGEIGGPCLSTAAQWGNVASPALAIALPLVIAYFAACPVNKALLCRGKGRAITHHASGGGPMDNRPLACGISALMLGGFVASLGTLL